MRSTRLNPPDNMIKFFCSTVKNIVDFAFCWIHQFPWSIQIGKTGIPACQGIMHLHSNIRFWKVPTMPFVTKVSKMPKKYSSSNHATERSNSQYVWDVYVTKFWQMFLETIGVPDNQVTDTTRRCTMGAFWLLRMGKRKNWLRSTGNHKPPQAQTYAGIWIVNWKELVSFQFIPFALTSFFWID